ncbi:hypothetical protein CEQ90_07000 [Lewinellaceae bacterium SD302]|nr:hypothetical protein CEQ90_07000 [Lewinellaceae bacterium SD302]
MYAPQYITISLLPSNSIIALIPAAGAATRFGGEKQLAELDGKTLLAHVVSNCRAGGCDQVCVVSGDNHSKVAEEARLIGASVYYHEKWADGMASSLDFGLRQLMNFSDCKQVLILPCDMPWFTEEWIKRMANKVAELAGQSEQAVATIYPEGPGVPALLSRAFIEHCYFASPNKKLRETIAEFPTLRTIPSGPHTRDVDYREDLS